MKIKPKTQEQKIADAMIIEKFMNELHSSFVGKLFEGENGEPDTILLMQKYIDEGKGSSLEQILLGRAIAELVKLRHWRHLFMGVKEGADSTSSKDQTWRWDPNRIAEPNGIKISEYLPPPVRDEIIPPHAPYTTEKRLLSIENINKICREDEQSQLTEMIEGQSIANRYKSALEKLAQEEADENNKGNMK